MSTPWSETPWSFGRRFLRGLRWRIGATLGLLVGGLVAVLAFLLVAASHLAWYVDLVIVLGILVAAPAAVVVLWSTWGWALHRRLRAYCTGYRNE